MLGLLCSLIQTLWSFTKAALKNTHLRFYNYLPLFFKVISNILIVKMGMVHTTLRLTALQPSSAVFSSYGMSSILHPVSALKSPALVKALQWLPTTAEENQKTLFCFKKLSLSYLSQTLVDFFTLYNNKIQRRHITDGFMKKHLFLEICRYTGQIEGSSRHRKKTYTYL